VAHVLDRGLLPGRVGVVRAVRLVATRRVVAAVRGEQVMAVAVGGVLDLVVREAERLGPGMLPIVVRIGLRAPGLPLQRVVVVEIQNATVVLRVGVSHRQDVPRVDLETGAVGCGRVRVRENVVTLDDRVQRGAQGVGIGRIRRRVVPRGRIARDASRRGHGL